MEYKMLKAKLMYFWLFLEVEKLSTTINQEEG